MLVSEFGILNLFRNKVCPLPVSLVVESFFVVCAHLK